MAKTITSHFPDRLQVKDHFSNEAAAVYIYDNFAVVEVKEGTTLSFKNGFTLLLKGLMIMGTKPWVYVSNRINSYAVIPTDYKYLNKVPTLKGLVIVSSKKSEHNHAQFEKKFFKKPFVILNSLDEAYEWGCELLDND